MENILPDLPENPRVLIDKYLLDNTKYNYTDNKTVTVD